MQLKDAAVEKTEEVKAAANDAANKLKDAANNLKDKVEEKTKKN